MTFQLFNFSTVYWMIQYEQRTSYNFWQYDQYCAIVLHYATEARTVVRQDI